MSDSIYLDRIERAIWRFGFRVVVICCACYLGGALAFALGAGESVKSNALGFTIHTAVLLGVGIMILHYLHSLVNRLVDDAVCEALEMFHYDTVYPAMDEILKQHALGKNEEVKERLVQLSTPIDWEGIRKTPRKMLNKNMETGKGQ